MKLINFKLVTIICEPVLGANMIALAKEHGATGHTITEVSGEGSGKKSSGEVPDSKLKIEVVADLKMSEDIMSALAQKFFENYSLIAYITEISVLRPEKFEPK